MKCAGRVRGRGGVRRAFFYAQLCLVSQNGGENCNAAHAIRATFFDPTKGDRPVRPPAQIDNRFGLIQSQFGFSRGFS